MDTAKDPEKDPEKDPDKGFHVTLTNFEGPFDLLLQLIFARRLDVTEVVAPVREPRHGRAAGVEHEADTRGTEVEKRDNYSLTGIEAALRAAIVAS